MTDIGPKIQYLTMSNKPIAMKKLRSILRLHYAGKSKLFIAKTVGVSRNTVKAYLKRIESLNLPKEELIESSELELYALFCINKPSPKSTKIEQLLQFFKYAQNEISKPGVTKKLLWQEYIIKYPDGYKSSQFNHQFNKYRGIVKPSMRIEHKAGDKLYIDYAGKKLTYVDQETGEIIKVEVFVAALGASKLIYMEASPSQKKTDFIASVQNALHYYGGVPQAIVPDNLKSAVKKSHRYEPTLNEVFADFADFYQTTILPARAYRPKDKALVEGAVKIVYQSIYAPLRKQIFFSLEALNAALWKQLEILNNKKLSNQNQSRIQRFLEIEKNHLGSLPETLYEIKEQAWVTVMKTAHVNLQKDKHYYSVPYQFISKKVKLVWSSCKVHIYSNYQCIAEHERSKTTYGYTTVKDHMPSTHKFISSWSPVYFINWANSLGEDVKILIEKILEKKSYPEQAYRSCLGILNLSKKVGEHRLQDACNRAVHYERYDYKSVVNILERGLDNYKDEGSDTDLPKHENIRGKNYYK